MKNKEIVIIGSAYPLRGGLAAYNERIAREFQSQGYKVTIYTFSLQYPSILFPGKSQYSESAPPDDLSIKVCINSINPFNWIKVGLRLRKLKPSIIVVKFWIPFMGPCFGTILRLAKNKNTRIISIIDNIVPHEKRPGDVLFANYFVKPVDAFITMSRAVLAQMEAFTKKEKRFIPHPIYDHYGSIEPKHTAIKQLGLDPNYKYLLFFGFIRGYKGLDWLIEAMASEEIEKLKVKAIVAGEFYEDDKPYLSLIESTQTAGRLEMHTKFIPDEQVKNYFNASDLVVQPYKDATQSGVTQIAYHFNKPMIVTNVGGLSEFIPHGKVGYVVEPSPLAIREAIIDFFSNNKQSELEQGVREEKLKYSWTTMTRAIEELANCENTIKS